MPLNTSTVRAKTPLLAGIALTVGWLVVYLFTVSPTVNLIDSGELITAAYEPGIAHPPGYPLYVLMGYVVTHLLWGEVAWRLNVLSAFWAALAVGATYALVLSIYAYTTWRAASTQPQFPARRPVTGSRKAPVQVVQASGSAQTTIDGWTITIAAASASLLGASASFWSRSAQAKMYSLHFFFVATLFCVALGYRQAYERRDERASPWWLAGLTATGALSFTNHLMTNLLVPGVLVLVLTGEGWRDRLRKVLREWKVILLAATPLLLYLYLPLRMSQGPFMNWGSPDDWGDFLRHVGVWQYRTYWMPEGENNIGPMAKFAGEQWGRISWPVIVAGLAGGVALLRRNRWVYLATLLTFLITLVFVFGYNISEIEPYLVPLYMILVAWLGTGALIATEHRQASARAGDAGILSDRTRPIVAGGMALAALLLAAFQFPQQDRSRDYIAPRLVSNVFSEIPQNSILITDYWDFYAPTYYIQKVRGERPDLTIVDLSLLKYPWYTEQLRKQDPGLVAKSEDILARFSLEQRKWVNDEPFDAAVLDSSYSELLTSFVTRNPERRAFVLFTEPCNALQIPQGCEGSRVAPEYGRFPAGLAQELIPPDGEVRLPEFPEYDLRGITTERVRLDDFSLKVAQHYRTTYQQLADLYTSRNATAQAQRAATRAAEITAVLEGAGGVALNPGAP